MKVQEYRDLLDNVFEVLNSAKSAATSNEQRKECLRLERAWEELSRASCARMSHRDEQRSETAERLVRAFLAQKREEFASQDAALQRMAFGILAEQLAGKK